MNRNVPILLEDCCRAIVELAFARIRLAQISMDAIMRGNEWSEIGGNSPRSSALVDRIAFVVPRVARRLPFRSDCLVQALAAQRWLRSRGLSSRIIIGVDVTGTEDFVAHAWLMHRDRVVTGGDISRYAPLFGDGGDLPERFTAR